MDHAAEIDTAGIDGLDRSGADTVVAEAARDYFDGVRQRIGPFIDANFTVAGLPGCTAMRWAGTC